MSIDLDYLIELLEKRYPNKLPRSKEVTIDEIRFQQGIQQCIDYLLELKETEERKRLENKMSKPRGA